VIEAPPAPALAPPATDRGELLALHGVAKAFGAKRVLDRLELTVATGELIGIGGANGIG